eukprot:Gb_15124 [translate_table: standard]
MYRILFSWPRFVHGWASALRQGTPQCPPDILLLGIEEPVPKAEFWVGLNWHEEWGWGPKLCSCKHGSRWASPVVWELRVGRMKKRLRRVVAGRLSIVGLLAAACLQDPKWTTLSVALAPTLVFLAPEPNRGPLVTLFMLPQELESSGCFLCLVLTI